MLREFNPEESLALNNSAASLYLSTHSLCTPPAKLLCDGRHPNGGALTTATLRTPNPYNSFDQFVWRMHKIIKVINVCLESEMEEHEHGN